MSNSDLTHSHTQAAAFTFIDLFAGVGGFHFALKALGGTCVFSSEWDKDAQKTYLANHGILPYGDITLAETKAKIPETFDILCAGFPCQAFSIAGYQKGFADSRGTLFFDIEQIAEKHRPKVIFLENVKNLVSHDKGRTFQTILSILDKLNYHVFYQVMNTAEYANIPQNRERIFIVAFNKESHLNYEQFSFPSKIPLTKTIHDFIDSEKQDDKFYYDHSKYIDTLKEHICSKNTLYQWRRVYVRENKNNLCPTLTANMGTGGHNVPLLLDDYGIRKLTPKECFAFQGYDMNHFVLPPIANSKLYMQAGNSVSMPLVKRIAERILRVMYELTKKQTTHLLTPSPQA
ncbi:DNA cytosine methyltransferase [Basilea psittacipulmonis]|uniref:DNA cytosine methyltransferase n=1 Tax=Basilea psittacipulmonis TaxID=1472345 RepID=UPI00068FE514|nr:DNA cytosine methyltransferase [Basilea psittacipulmonis]